MADLWVWTRFYANPDDYRPIFDPAVGTPGLGPYWCSGYGDDYSVVCAWVRPGVDVRKYWPEATNIDSAYPSKLTFTDRFPEPEWWAEHEENNV